VTDPLRIGVFGGSFDPVHVGHLGIAQQARESFRLDTVIFVPSASPPHKGGRAVADAADRLEMARLAISGHPRFQASDLEMRRDGPSYTIDTLEEMQNAHPAARLFFIVGADSLAELDKWHRAGELVSRFDFIIVGRPGTAEIPGESLAAAFGGQAAARLQAAFLRTGVYNISATEIRSRVAAGQSITFLVPPAVERYIHKSGLYR
jgi:nicotinate-nucleotide adenylyltransferase